jgi:uncharacterized DUF497 family protein
LDYDFEWDEHNEEKLLLRHFVRPEEVEQVFYNRASVRRQGDSYMAVGRTDAGRALLVVFERRGSLIRPFSARDLTSRERQRFGL